MQKNTQRIASASESCVTSFLVMACQALSRNKSRAMTISVNLTHTPEDIDTFCRDCFSGSISRPSMKPPLVHAQTIQLQQYLCAY